jgi:hypothetical protein
VVNSEIERLREENERWKALIKAIGTLCAPADPKFNWTEDLECRRAAVLAGCEIVLRNFLIDQAAINSVVAELEAIIQARIKFRAEQRS